MIFLQRPCTHNKQYAWRLLCRCCCGALVQGGAAQLPIPRSHCQEPWRKGRECIFISTCPIIFFLWALVDCMSRNSHFGYLKILQNLQSSAKPARWSNIIFFNFNTLAPADFLSQFFSCARVHFAI